LNNEAQSGGLYQNLISDATIYKIKGQFSYDSHDNLAQFSKASDARNTVLYNYQHSLKVAEIQNAQADQVAYTSFEADDPGGWAYSGGIVSDGTSPTGSKCYSLSGGLTRGGLSASQAYILSYWSKSGAYLVNGSGPVLTGRTVDGWTYYEHSISGQTSVSFSGSGYIDEVRLYPKNALMTTATYNPLIGVSSQCDANNRISYFFYDPFGRLKYVKDQDKNIIRTIDYHFKNAF
jgi:hypothetical protein